MRLPFAPPLAPMLSSAADALPGGEGWQFEPKWDGFRTLVFRDGDEILLQSRDEKPRTDTSRSSSPHWPPRYQRSGESYRAGEYRSSHRAHFSLHRGQVARMVRDNDDLPRPDRSFGLFL